MSLHRSLKTISSALNQHRNVLTRAERITKLSESDRFHAGTTSPLGVGKVISRMVATKKPKKEAAEGEAGAAAPAAAPAGKAAAPAKAAPPKK